MARVPRAAGAAASTSVAGPSSAPPAAAAPSSAPPAPRTASGSSSSRGGGSSGGGRAPRSSAPVRPAPSPLAGPGTRAVVSEGAGVLLAVMFWGWVALPFLKGGPDQVKDVLRAKFLNQAPDGSWLP